MNHENRVYKRRIVFLLLFAILTFIGCLLVIFRGVAYVCSWELVSFCSLKVAGVIIIDWISLLFISFVSLISSIVLFYSGSYIRGDENLTRFLYLVLGFVISIIFLIIRPNIIRILLGWDGLGLVSYALVIYYQNEKSANAGMLTALSNRIGDVAILLRIRLMVRLGRWNYVFYREEIAWGILAFVVLAAITKRAQIPYSAWLPAAIAAPTPVSALVHSSTLVTAGVYLLIRFRPALLDSVHTQILLLLARLTMFMAGLGANFETDLKKIIALSTLRQLGVIMSILSLGRADLAFFHLLTHALFKALLFICAGSIIHRVGDYQDIRLIGGLVKSMPIRVIRINLANLALCGAPFLAGFYSKDLILETRFQGLLNEFCFYLLVVSTGLTVSYTFRIIFYSFRGTYNLLVFSAVRDESKIITWPIVVLGVGAVRGGSLLSWLILPCPAIICLRGWFKSLVITVRLIGGLVGYTVNLIALNQNLISSLARLSGVIRFARRIWFIPFLSTRGVPLSFIKLGRYYHQVGDIGWSEYYGGQGSYKRFEFVSRQLQVAQDNNMKIYITIMVVWVVLIIAWVYLGSSR